MGYYTFDLLPLTTIHVIEFWLAKIIWAGQAFFCGAKQPENTALKQGDWQYSKLWNYYGWMVCMLRALHFLKYY